MTHPNLLYYGDNLDILRTRIVDASVDLVYLDPPFNSQRSYNVIFKEATGKDAAAQIQAFGDSWTWGVDSEETYLSLVASAPTKVADAIEGMHRVLGRNDVLAYLVMMAPRLIELRRVLKSTGALYLHCDPTASHYLKILLDAIFGAEHFGNEIIWKRTSGHSDARRYGRTHDVILYYAKDDQTVWNQLYQAYDENYVEQYYRYKDPDGRRFMSGDAGAAGLAGGGYTYAWKGITRLWRFPIETMEQLDNEGRLFYTKNGFPRVKRYLDESKGMPMQDIWADLEALRSWHRERLGYQTQKPQALLERIIAASSNPGDLVLDPFCGCGTTVDASQKLGRRWIGIDVTTLAIHLIDARLRKTYGEEIRDTYEIEGIPRDVAGADALFERDPFEFERWCVMQVDGQPNEKQVGDRGIDGVIRLPTSAQGATARALVSVKGGKTGPSDVRDLVGTVETQKAAMGIFISRQEPTPMMLQAAATAGTYDYPLNRRSYPKVQIITVAQLLNGDRPNMPTPLLPYVQAVRRHSKGGQIPLDFNDVVTS